jgi:hypothetical protein
VGFLLELILELILEVAWLLLSEVVSGFLSALLGSAFPRLREAMDRGAPILWALAVAAGAAAGSVSLSVAPHRVSSGPLSALAAWLLLPLLAGTAAELTGRRLRRDPSTRQAWFVAGLLFGVAYLAVRLVIPR